MEERAKRCTVTWSTYCLNGYKTLFMLNLTEHENLTAHKTNIQTNEEVSQMSYLSC